MDLYGINPLISKGYSDRTHFRRNENTSSGPHSKVRKVFKCSVMLVGDTSVINILTVRNLCVIQFVNNDILSSSAWSSVIHQPSQDSEPEDLPSTVDINAIKVS